MNRKEKKRTLTFRRVGGGDAHLKYAFIGWGEETGKKSPPPLVIFTGNVVLFVSKP